jgi:hypothetical protein
MAAGRPSIWRNQIMKYPDYSVRISETKTLWTGLAVAVSFLTLVQDSMSAASRIKVCRFENGTFDGWIPDGDHNVPQFTTIDPHSGNICLSLNWNGTFEWNARDRYQSIQFESFPYTGEVFTRFWVKIDADMDVPGDETGPKIFKWGTFTPNEIYIYPRMTDGEIVEAPNNNTGLAGGDPAIMSTFSGSSNSTVFPRGTWHKIEHYMKTGNPGTITLWVDDKLCKTWTINTDVGGRWYPLHLASNWSGGAKPGGRDHDANNHMYFDDFELFTDSTQGTPTTGSMAAGNIEAVTATAPEIAVTVNGVSITNGATVNINATPTNDVNIQNLGNAILTLGPVSLSGANASDFSIIRQPSASVIPMSNTVFSVKFDPRATGLSVASVSFPNNDSNENPFHFSIQGTSTSASNGPVAYWRFDEGEGLVARDDSSTNNAGALQNGPSWTTGWLGSALRFDRTDDVVNVSNGGFLNNLPAFSIVAFINPLSAGEGEFGRIVHKGDGVNPSGGFRFLLARFGQLRLGVDYATTDLERFSSTNAIALGMWQHVAVTWDGSSAARNAHFYVNGVETTYGGTIDGVGVRGNDSASDLNIGNNSTLERTFDGAIDEVRIYNRALGALEVQMLYETTSLRIERIARSGATVTISWPGHPNVVLQRRSLPSSAWYDVSDSLGASTVTEAIDIVGAMYRLKLRP